MEISNLLKLSRAFWNTPGRKFLIKSVQLYIANTGKYFMLIVKKKMKHLKLEVSTKSPGQNVYQMKKYVT